MKVQDPWKLVDKLDSYWPQDMGPSDDVSFVGVEAYDSLKDGAQISGHD